MNDNDPLSDEPVVPTPQNGVVALTVKAAPRRFDRRLLVLVVLIVGGFGSYLFHSLSPATHPGQAGVTVPANAKKQATPSQATPAKLHISNGAIVGSSPAASGAPTEKPFRIQGVQIIGKLTPLEYRGSVSEIYRTANAHFGTDELDKARAVGANTLRFQISQIGFDASSTQQLDHIRYVNEVKDAVNLALTHNFKVILSMQWQGGSGANYDQVMPGENTLRAWQTLGPIWKDDTRVFYELYNEPSISATIARDGSPNTQHWEVWKNGGPGIPGTNFAKNKTPDNPTGVVIGMNALIAKLRALGSKNVIIVTGLDTQKSFYGMQQPDDPLHNLAYGVHSPKLSGGTAWWDKSFGYLAASVPVIVTEWAANSATPDCESNYPSEARTFLQYLDKKTIGVNGFAFDLPGSIIKDWSYAPTTYSAFTCNGGDAPSSRGGQGELLKAAYLDQAY